MIYGPQSSWWRALQSCIIPLNSIHELFPFAFWPFVTFLHYSLCWVKDGFTGIMHQFQLSTLKRLAHNNVHEQGQAVIFVFILKQRNLIWMGLMWMHDVAYILIDDQLWDLLGSCLTKLQRKCSITNYLFLFLTAADILTTDSVNTIDASQGSTCLNYKLVNWWGQQICFFSIKILERWHVSIANCVSFCCSLSSQMCFI